MCPLLYYLVTMVTSTLLVRLYSASSLSQCFSLSTLYPLMYALYMIWWFYWQVADLCPLLYTLVEDLTEMRLMIVSLLP